MSTIEYMYDGKVVEFFFQEDIMVNATEMGTVFGKRPYDFLKTETAKKLVARLEKTSIRASRMEDSSIRLAGNSVLGGEIKARSEDLVPLIVVSKGGDYRGETWMHRYIALDFAMWMDVDFKIWVLRKIDELTFSYGARIRSIMLSEKELELEKKKILDSSTNPEVVRLAEIERTRRQLKGAKLNSAKDFNRTIFDKQ